MRRNAAELASTISRALISASNKTLPLRPWTSSMDQTLHRLGCRDSLSPALVEQVIDPLLLHHHSLAFGFFNWASQQPGFSHTSSTYQSVLKSLSISRQFNSIDKIMKQIRIQKIPIDPSVCRQVIASLLAGKKTNLAYMVLCQVGSVVGPEICNSLLAALAADGSMDSAHKVFDEMIKTRVPLSTLGFGIFMWKTSRRKEVRDILSLLDEVRKVDFSGIDGSIVALLVIHGLCAEKRAKDAILSLEGLRENDCKPDFMAYRIVAETLREMGSVVDVQMILKRKRKFGVAPRADDYRGFILQLVKERLLCEAKELGEIIISGNFPIEEDVLNVLIGSVSAIDPLLAFSFLKFMLGQNRLPASLTLINLSEQLCKHEKTDELVEVFELLSTKEYFTNLEGYNVMISFLCKGGRVKESYKVLQEMKRKGLTPDVSSFNYLLAACCKEDLVRPAKRLWDEMFACGCCGNSESYNLLIRKFSEVGQIENACHLFNQMLGKGFEPDLATYTFLLEGLCQAKDFETALAIFNKSTQHDAKLRNTLLSTFIICLCKEGFLHGASKLLHEVPCDMECLESHLTLLKHSVENEELSLATEHLQWVADKSLVLLHAVRIELPASLSTSSKPDSVSWLLEQLKKVSNDMPSRKLDQLY